MKSKLKKAIFNMVRGDYEYTVSFSKTKGRDYEIEVLLGDKSFCFRACLCPNMTHANDAIDRFHGFGRLTNVKPNLKVVK